MSLKCLLLLLLPTACWSCTCSSSKSSASCRRKSGCNWSTTSEKCRGACRDDPSYGGGGGGEKCYEATCSGTPTRDACTEAFEKLGENATSLDCVVAGFGGISCQSDPIGSPNPTTCTMMFSHLLCDNTMQSETSLTSEACEAVGCNYTAAYCEPSGAIGSFLFSTMTVMVALAVTLFIAV